MSGEKIIKVIITGNAKEEFDELNKIVGNEIKNNVLNSDYQILLKSIKQKIELLKNNPQYGINISKNKIPVQYISDFDVNNLWKINLADAWRMIYTIKGNKIEIICLILDLIDHKKYSKKFNYKY
jgi:hypothetical protein